MIHQLHGKDKLPVAQAWHDFLIKSISSIAIGIGRDYLEWE
jgi:hypothetical protein